jgi:Fe-S-cluster containining protein
MKTFPKPKCKQCGECCRYSWSLVGSDEERYTNFYGIKHKEMKITWGLINHKQVRVYCLPQPCQHLIKNKCNLHGKPEQPDVCKEHGFGAGMFYPEGCAFYDYYKDMPEGVDDS